MTKTMKVEGPLHVICQCDKCKPQISFNAEVIGYVEPQRTWAGLTDDERKDLCRSWSSPMDAIYATEAKLKDKNERISP